MLYTDCQSGRTAAIARHVSFAQINCSYYFCYCVRAFVTFFVVSDMVEREFEHYTSPLPAGMNYSNWQTIKQRTFSAPHKADGSVVFQY